jgi:hypothetical protein
MRKPAMVNQQLPGPLRIEFSRIGHDLAPVVML